MKIGDKVFVVTWVGPCGERVLGVAEAVVTATPKGVFDETASDDEVLSLVKLRLDGEERLFSANGVYATREAAEAKASSFSA